MTRRILGVAAAFALAVALSLGGRATADKPTKTEIVHNGHVICVSQQGAANHLAHHPGDSPTGNTC